MYPLNTPFSLKEFSPMSSLEIDCQTVKAKMDNGDSFLLLDCREQAEYNLVHIDDAVLLPMSEIQNRFEELNDYQEKEIIIYCHHGMRSRQVAEWLLQQGYSHVKSMRGGIDTWASDVDFSMSRY